MRKFDCNSSIRWPTTVTAKPKISRQNQKSHGKNNIPHDNTRNLTVKPKSSRQYQILQSKNQIPHGKTKAILLLLWSIWFCREVFGLPWCFCFCREVFGFGVRYFVFAVSFLGLPWGILFLPWGFWVCREVFGFAVRYFVFAVRVWFCRDSCGPPYL